VVFAGSNSRAPYLAAEKRNGANVFGGDTYVLDADGGRQEVLFGADLLVDEYASRQLGALRLLGRGKSNDDKPGRRE
jgi:hypothetical protein